MTTIRDVKLSDRYERDEGEVFLTGLQAAVRLPIDQAMADRAAGRSVATLISGYQGSPLAGYDLELLRQQKLLDEHDIVFRPAVNEELAANAVQGSQLAAEMESRRVDGVVGIWYGKAPGLDRATDALRHANLGGASATGGALVLVGDDSVAKSSTVPSSSEVAIAELGMPVLSPADPQEILDLGRHGIALSRFSGLWVGMKLATNVVDGSATTTLNPHRVVPQLPDNTVDGVPYRHTVTANFLQPHLAPLEQSLVGARIELARRYGVANGLAQVHGDPNARIGIISAGLPFRDTVQALERLGLAEADLVTSGLRLLKLGMIHPLDPGTVRDFCRGLDEVIVVEEKKPFIELAVKDILFDAAERPAVLGKRDRSGAVFLRADADLPPDYLADRLVGRLEAHGVAAVARPKTAAPAARAALPMLTRTPYFCSGCPHNRSTVVPDGSLVGAGIGCSGLATIMPAERVGTMIGFSQMGGEGAPWIGMAPFVTEPHLFQNLGDGTFHHSGLLAIRASIGAGSNITYKLLYNDAVAMTGGQTAVNKLTVPRIVSELLAEGVAKIVITTDDVDKYRQVRLPRGVRVLDRTKLIAVQEELATVAGVTVLIHDQECATELRRKRKRKLVKEPVQRAFINERVCEGCGDCGKKSNCMSVQPKNTAFGRKTTIDQASCNKDYSCLEGDCPSFVAVVPGKKAKPATVDVATLPDPEIRVNRSDFGLRLTGVGGTGVVTTAQIISTAATLDGAYVRGLDQLGMAQKGGAVVSDIRLSDVESAGTNKLAPGECDLYLGCDVLVAAAESNLAVASTDRTIAVVSTSPVPTGAMILAPGTAFPSAAEAQTLIDAVSRAGLSVYADVRAISTANFGSDQFANTMLMGMAVQAGALPISPAMIERAIGLNGVAVQSNERAFRLGRQLVVDRSTVAGAAPATAAAVADDARSTEIVARLGTEASDAVRALVERFVPELIAYQNPAYAQRFVSQVEKVRAREADRLGHSGELTERFASALFKLMAYKDEYEVARLYLDPSFATALEHEFGAGARYSYRLHPPILRAMGVDHKISLGPWFRHVFRLLYALRVVRGTPLDVFGYAAVRQAERRLVRSYPKAAFAAVGKATATNRAVVADILALPEEIRGYEGIKLSNVEIYEQRLADLTAALA